MVLLINYVLKCKHFRLFPQFAIYFRIRCTNKFPPFFIKNCVFIVKKRNVMSYSMYCPSYCSFCVWHESWSNNASNSLLLIKEVNQKSPQMTLIRLKTRHFCTQKNILYWWKSTNISRLCYWQMSNHTAVVFYICQFQPKLTGDANFCQTAETYLYTWHFSNRKFLSV